MNIRTLICTVIVVLAFVTTKSMAAAIVMEGNYIKTAVSDDGTLGYEGLGILYDPTGTQSFTNDVLSPGTSWEIFSISSNQTGLLVNRNHGHDDIEGNLFFINSPTEYGNYAGWDAIYEDYFWLSLRYYFDDNLQTIFIETFIYAVQDLNNVSFLRAIDPDQDFSGYGYFETFNLRGYEDARPEDFVYAVGPGSGSIMGLYSNSDYYHNTASTNPWSEDPQDYLNGGALGYGDQAIGIAVDFGDIKKGEVVRFAYQYMFGPNLDTAYDPIVTRVDVPEPTSLIILALSVLGIRYRSFTR
ncbi:hypothetical protein FE810_12115 [Thalassotalea litorea]|uniref:PEP-CTERM sorting domain-containing protein n=1 Tax=Thalassotalea litorea TaxID=2020715 RepID=A0A5R9IR14_9GAMM|nr:hypothetical protein [Thalassotalea litorea]TLU64338.1 hypothetical protein FE810_12115 [Thalassotalea litorea]